MRIPTGEEDEENEEDEEDEEGEKDQEDQELNAIADEGGEGFEIKLRRPASQVHFA